MTRTSRDDNASFYEPLIPPNPPNPRFRQKNISKKSAFSQKHVQKFHLPALNIEGSFAPDPRLDVRQSNFRASHEFPTDPLFPCSTRWSSLRQLRARRFER